MNIKTIMVISMATILSLAVTVPAIAEAFPSLKKAVVDVEDDTFNLRFQFEGKSSDIVPPAFGGVAVLTDAGTAIAATTHDRFYDSEKQTAPQEEPVVSFGVAALCTGTDPGCGPEWHIHIVNPVEDDRCFTGLAVGELTWEDPSEKLKLAGPNIIAKKIALGANEYTASLAGETLVFDAGTVPDANGSLAFDLTPIFTDTEEPIDPTTLAGICIGPLAASED